MGFGDPPSAAGPSKLGFASFQRLSRKAKRVAVWRRRSSDSRTASELFAGFRTAPPAFLLEDASGRYAYLGERAVPTAFSQADELRLSLREKFGRSDELPPFSGGWVGYWGHDFCRQLEPSVACRPDPDFPAVELFRVDRLIALDRARGSTFLIACVEPDEHSSHRQAYDLAQRELDALEKAIDQPPPALPSLSRPTDLRSLWSREGFERAVEAARAAIAAGELLQLVLSRRLVARHTGPPFDLYRQLCASSAEGTHRFHLELDGGRRRALIGASPELLLSLTDRTLRVRPIAGTRPRGGDADEDQALEVSLRGDPKELAEHVMLLDLGRNDVGRVALPGTVRIEEREVIERHRQVMHLVSQVAGELPQNSCALDALAAIFPAGTVSGAPKVRALQLIGELEPLPRGPYAGAVGWLGYGGGADLALNIRSLVLTGSELRFQAGAGIVHDSSPAREFEETSHKLRAALSPFGLEEP